MKLADFTIKPGSGSGAHVATARLDDGKTFTWSFHVGFSTPEADLTRFAKQAMADVVAYCGAKIPPPLPAEPVVGGPAQPQGTLP